MADAQSSRSGLVAVVGRPNVGKSTLLNALVGQKISITTPKPQTTRHRVLGISTHPGCQVVYVDTPGLHRRRGRALNRYLNRSASSSLADVDLVLMVVQALTWTEDDEFVAELVRRSSARRLVAVNKCDLVRDKTRLLPYLVELGERCGAEDLWPIAAINGDGLPELEHAICALLPEGEPFYPEDQVTDRSERFLVSEIVREKLTLRLGDELPYRITVEIEGFEDSPDMARIGAVVWVESQSQKAIVIGKGGSMLKAVGSAARRDIETLLGKRVYLEIWAKVQDDWSDNEAALRRLGYED